MIVGKFCRKDKYSLEAILTNMSDVPMVIDWDDQNAVALHYSFLNLRSEVLPYYVEIEERSR